jgi:serine/threonine protein kinase
MSLSDRVLEHLREVTDDPDLSGTKYELLEPIGRGGMGAVYRVNDNELDRPVAMKVLAAPDPSGELTARLLLEARFLARLEHPGIVPVYDAGVLPDGRPYCVMKHVSGQRFDAWLATGPSRTAALELVARICETVAFAHAHGVIHRDLKPANIMVGQYGEALVMDWGVAKEVGAPGAQNGAPSAGNASGALGGPGARSDDRRSSDPQALTGHGVVVGTTSWMAPEQARGEAADQRSDVYALGTLLAYVAGDDAPPSLAAVCARAMAAAPADRYPAADELAKDIRRYLAGESVSAYPESPLVRFNRILRPYRPLLALLGIYLAIRIAIFFWSGD